MKKWLLPICVLVVPIGFILVLSGWLQIEIDWANASIATIGMLIYFDMASRLSGEFKYIDWYIGNLDRKDTLKSLGLTYILIIASFLINLVGNEIITLRSVVFVIVTLSAYVLLYIVSWRYFEKANSSFKEQEQ